MNLDSPSSSFGLAAVLATELNGRNNGASHAFRLAYMNFVFQTTFSQAAYDDAIYCPAHTLYWKNGVLIVLMLGARWNTQAHFFVGGYRDAVDRSPDNGFNQWVAGAARLVLANIIAEGCGTTTRVILAGHSCGGCVMNALAVLLRSSLASQRISLMSFGSPRCGRVYAGGLLGNIDIFRYMNSGDPCSRFIFHSGEAPVWEYFAGEATCAVADLYIQVGDGVVMGPNGDRQYMEQPYLTSTNNDISLASFLIRNESGEAIEHRIHTYLTRLELFAIRDNDNNLDVAVVGVPQVNWHIPPPVVPRPPAFFQGLPPPEVTAFPVVNPVPTQPPPFKWIRVEGQNCLYAGDIFVCVCPTKRHAKNMAKRFNSAWNLWYSSTYGDSVALDQAIVANFVGDQNNP